MSPVFMSKVLICMSDLFHSVSFGCVSFHQVAVTWRALERSALMDRSAPWRSMHFSQCLAFFLTANLQLDSFQILRDHCLDCEVFSRIFSVGWNGNFDKILILEMCSGDQEISLNFNNF